MRDLNEVFQPFVEKSAVSVMARAALERLLSPACVDEVFEKTTDGQYTRTLLFSSVFAVMVRVVFKQAKSARWAYQHRTEAVGVSLRAQGVVLVSAPLIEVSADGKTIHLELVQHVPFVIAGALPGTDGTVVRANVRVTTVDAA